MALGAKGKGAIIIISTLLVGIVLGSVSMGWYTRQRLRHIPNPRFFERSTLRLIEPHDDAQREKIREILGEMAPRFMELDARHREAVHTLIDSVNAALKPHLDAEQWARVEDRKRHFNEMTRKWGGRRGGPRGNRREAPDRH
ncbi:MAG: hypothetical protein ACKVJG_04725 [Candidatus Latescibacterota bacterium]|jgi:hypothetical protein